MKEQDGLNLLQEFPAVSTEQWDEVIRKDLKGTGYALGEEREVAEGRLSSAMAAERLLAEFTRDVSVTAAGCR